MQKALRIKLYGESFKIHKLHIPEKDFHCFQSVADELKQSLDQALLDIRFFARLNLSNYQSISDLIVQTFGGLVNDPKNRIEVSWGRRKVARLNCLDLLQPKTLFPLYQTRLFSVNLNKIPKGLYLVEREVGLIAWYEAQEDNFKFENLVFHLADTSFQNTAYKLLIGVEYKKEILMVRKSDSLLKYQLCFGKM